MTIEDIEAGAERLINDILRRESQLQGHTLTGKMEDSFTSKRRKQGKVHIMEGFAVYYTRFVNDGVPAASASMKQFPFVLDFWHKRGLTGKEARGAAAATIHKWMKFGMPTQASKRFSKTGARQNMIESAFVGGSVKLDEYMSHSLDFAIDEHYRKEKSETI